MKLIIIAIKSVLIKFDKNYVIKILHSDFMNDLKYLLKNM